MEQMLIDRLSTLSHPQRMAVFRLLMRRYPDQVPAGAIVAALVLKPSTASVYLSALTQCGLITQRRDGTRLLYSVNLSATKQVMADLFFDCCRGRADLCPPQTDRAAARRQGQKTRVLFVCSGNSARSILAETILCDIGGEDYLVHSAGIAKRSDLNPLAVEVLRENGHDPSSCRPQNMTDYHGPDAPQMDIVLTVCNQAANRDVPPWPGHPVTGHWGMPDPMDVAGNRADQRRAMAETYDALYRRIRALVALPFDKLDRASFQRQVDAIGKSPTQQDWTPR